MAASKPRAYTGWNGNADKITPGLDLLIRIVTRRTDSTLRSLGAWGVRPKRGKESPSVHGTGRAVDLGWTNRKRSLATIERLIAIADEIGLELAIDYFPPEHGRAWRCDRNEWKNYTRHTVDGAPGGRWYHLEISPAMANNPQAMKAALDKAFPVNPPQPS